MQCIIDDLPTDLTAEQREQAIRFISNNAGVFSKSEFDIGRTPFLEHSIETADSRPVRQALHRHPIAYLPLIDEYVQQMQDNGIVEPRIGSECVSNIVLVRKKDGALRYCTDYQGLNAVTTRLIILCLSLIRAMICWGKFLLHVPGHAQWVLAGPSKGGRH